ncbi:MAG: A/G-specific adenine glycosylase, partial [Candidatus Marinimicrobia bacterium]|nr:A/G-specific adenine glycosylase [Candidatus Neomarinimicrobiota bacterium]
MYNTSINISKWYSLNKRDLPWRKSRDPYKIWLSEVMLQQTQVETVIPYYERWLNKYPTVNSVASEKIDKLLKIWEGLGYYSRCRNFHEATKEI